MFRRAHRPKAAMRGSRARAVRGALTACVLAALLVASAAGKSTPDPPRGDADPPRVGDIQTSDKQRFSIRAFFRRLDVDGDGQIETDELSAYVGSSVGGNDFDEASEIAAAAASTTALIDGGDQGSTISEEELMTHITRATNQLLTPNRVARWVRFGLSLPQYSDAFSDNAVTALDFPVLVADHGAVLRDELGVKSGLHHGKILRALKRQILGLGRAARRAHERPRRRRERHRGRRAVARARRAGHAAGARVRAAAARGGRPQVAGGRRAGRGGARARLAGRRDGGGERESREREPRGFPAKKQKRSKQKRLEPGRTAHAPPAVPRRRVGRARQQRVLGPLRGGGRRRRRRRRAESRRLSERAKTSRSFFKRRRRHRGGPFFDERFVGPGDALARRRLVASHRGGHREIRFRRGVVPGRPGRAKRGRAPQSRRRARARRRLFSPFKKRRRRTRGARGPGGSPAVPGTPAAGGARGDGARRVPSGRSPRSELPEARRARSRARA